MISIINRYNEKKQATGKGTTKAGEQTIRAGENF